MTTRVQPQDKFVTTNGIKLHYLDWGTVGKPVMLLLHGLRGHGHSWDNFSEAACQDYHVLAFDQRGRGESDPAPGGDYSTEAFVADLDGVFEALQLDSAILVGHSMGGRNSMAFTGRYPERVNKLIIVDIGPAPHPKGGSGQRIRREIVGVPEEFDSFEDVYNHVRTENTLPPEYVLRRRLKYQTKELPNGKIGWRYDLAIREQWRQGTVAPSESLWPEYREFTCPILLVRGVETDNLVSELAQEMLEANSHATLVEIQRAHHMVFEENPDDFIVEVTRWLEETS